MDENLKKEIENRRTFAIISHPDAGKTTLTEKFLLYGGAINTAGSVKGKANSKYAVSDWMGIEKERGISDRRRMPVSGWCKKMCALSGNRSRI